MGNLSYYICKARNIIEKLILQIYDMREYEIYIFFSLSDILLTQLWLGYEWLRSPAWVALIAGSIYSRHPERVLVILDEIIDRTACIVDHRPVGPHIGASEPALNDVVCDLATTVCRWCWPGEADWGRGDVADDGSTGWCGSACKRRERLEFWEHFFFPDRSNSIPL